MKRYSVFVSSCILATIGTASAIVILAVKQQTPDLIDFVIVIFMWLPAGTFDQLKLF